MDVVDLDGDDIEHEPGLNVEIGEVDDNRSCSSESAPDQPETISLDRRQDWPAERARFTKTQKRVLSRLSFAIASALSCWFAATGIPEHVLHRWGIYDSSGVIYLTTSVNAGFVVGCAGMATQAKMDLPRLQILLAIGLFGVSATTAMLTISEELGVALFMRFCTGMQLSLVYPACVKLASSWYHVSQRCNALGLLFCAFCAGAAVPSFVACFSGVSTIPQISAFFAFVGALVVIFSVEDGPLAEPSAPINNTAAMGVLRNRRSMLAIIGYCGHMWEVFAMWASCAALWSDASGFHSRSAALLAGVSIAMGCVGSLLGGWLGGKFGRARVAAAAMFVSACCSILTAYLTSSMVDVTCTYSQALLLCTVWGVALITVSPQCSSLVMGAVDPRFVGTALSVQLGLGYGSSVMALFLVPVFADNWGWHSAMLLLAAGPITGFLSMMCLLQDDYSKINLERNRKRGGAVAMEREGRGRISWPILHRNDEYLVTEQCGICFEVIFGTSMKMQCECVNNAYHSSCALHWLRARPRCPYCSAPQPSPPPTPAPIGPGLMIGMLSMVLVCLMAVVVASPGGRPHPEIYGKNATDDDGSLWLS